MRAFARTVLPLLLVFTLTGKWMLVANTYRGTLEFTQVKGSKKKWQGRVWIDAYGRWEPLEEITYDAKKNTVNFFRRSLMQEYTGKFSKAPQFRTRIEGTYREGGRGEFPWTAEK
jgi:hypothetical protein